MLGVTLGTGVNPFQFGQSFFEPQVSFFSQGQVSHQVSRYSDTIVPNFDWRPSSFVGTFWQDMGVRGPVSPFQSSFMEEPTLPSPQFSDYNQFKEHFDSHAEYYQRGTLLVLSRHGTSLFNRVRLINGTNNSPLLDAGRLEVGALAQTLGDMHVDRFYSSSLERAHQSALILQNELNIAAPLQLDDRLAEFERGVLAGRPKRMDSAEIDALFAKFEEPEYQAWFMKNYDVSYEHMQLVFEEAKTSRIILQALARDVGLSEDQYAANAYECEDTLDCPPPLGESWQDGIDHVDQFIASELSTPQNETVFLVGHSTMHRMMIWRLLGYDIQSIDQLYQIQQEIAGVNVLFKPEGTDDWELLVLNSDRFGRSAN